MNKRNPRHKLSEASQEMSPHLFEDPVECFSGLGFISCWEGPCKMRAVLYFTVLNKLGIWKQIKRICYPQMTSSVTRSQKLKLCPFQTVWLVGRAGGGLHFSPPVLSKEVNSLIGSSGGRAQRSDSE